MGKKRIHDGAHVEQVLQDEADAQTAYEQTAQGQAESSTYVAALTVLNEFDALVAADTAPSISYLRKAAEILRAALVPTV